MFELHEPSDLPSIAEPFFMSVSASIDVSPVMTLDDVRAGLEKASPAFASA